jgi:hypothetical protein
MGGFGYNMSIRLTVYGSRRKEKGKRRKGRKNLRI